MPRPHELSTSVASGARAAREKRRGRAAGWVALFAMAWLAGCAPHKAPLVPLVAGGPLSPALYEQYRLIGDVGFFSAKWKRADGEYSFAQLEDVAEQFAESDDVYGRAATRATILETIGTTGAATVGFTLGFNLAANDETRWSPGAQAALYGVGGGLLAASFVLALVWADPAGEFAEVYNAALRRRLGLPEPPNARPEATSIWKPRPLENGGIGWRF
jgi:hypothetical protein